MSTGIPTLGVVAISKNEEEDMPRFLDHLLPWVDEIVIVDDGSTDATLEIIKAAGPKVKLIEHLMDHDLGFARQRNLGVEEASSDWLLHMDIGERVPPAFAKEILTSIRDDQKDGFRLRRLNFYLHRALRHGGLQRWNQVHLARRESLRFVGRVHERAELTCQQDRIGQLNQMMWHLNDNSFLERLEKSARYSELEGRRIVESGLNVRWYHFLFHPLFRAANVYIRRQGFRDGVPGLIYAFHQFNSTFNWYALAWDTQNRISRKTLEDDIAKS